MVLGLAPAAGNYAARHAGPREVQLVDDTERALRQKLRSVGYSNLAIDAAWPEWWGPGAEASISARAELRLTVARRLGIMPSSLFGNAEPAFIWRDAARFKNLGTTTGTEQAILSSFAVSLATMLVARAPDASVSVQEGNPQHLRELLRELGGYGLRNLVALAWALGVPVVQTNIFPLPRKRMHAVTASRSGRYAVVLGEATRFPAKAAFSVAHELGHVFLGHVGESPTLLDIEDPTVAESDSEESSANSFALELLTGAPAPEFTSAGADYNAAELANSALEMSAHQSIDPGTIVLCFALQNNDWARGTAALKLLGEEDVGSEVNRVAHRMLRWEGFDTDETDYLERVLGGQRAAE